MPRIGPVSWKKLKKVFEADGFKVDRITGDHIIMEKAGVIRPVVIQKISEVCVAMILSNIKTAGMDRERYFKLLNSV